MKNRILAMVLAIAMAVCLLPSAVFADEAGVELSEANFPDKTLREELRYYDTDEDGFLSEYEQYGPTMLELSGKSITTLKGIELLPHLMQLFVNNCGLTSIEALPENLMILSCENNGLTALPELPDSLINLYCSSNRIAELPKLPASLKVLDCSLNGLKSLPALPDTLEELRCGSNELTTLPELPDSLTSLDCGNNRLQRLPKLPAGLTKLSCQNNELRVIALRPDTIYANVNVSNNRLACKTAVLGKSADMWEPPLYSFGAQKPVDDAFADVPQSSYCYGSVLWAAEENITKGTSATTFEPSGGCTRGQVVTFLWRASGSPKVSGVDNPFVDVEEGSYYYDAVLWAVQNKITKGTTETTFSPDATIIRADAVTLIWRSEGEPGPTAMPEFTDIDAGSYYYGAMCWGYSSGVVKGTSATTFSPSETCTRGQIVTFLCRNAIR